MKNLITLLLYCLSVTALLAQSNGESNLEILSTSPTETILRLKISGIRETTVATPNAAAIIPQFEGGTPLLIKGVPDVPKFATALAIPNKGNMAVDVIESDFIEVQNIQVAPSKGNLLRKVNPADVPFHYGEAYQEDAFFPGNLAEMQAPFIFRETRGQALWIFPVQYNPAQKTMRVYRSITLRVYHTGGTGTNEQAGGPIEPAPSRVFDQLQRQFFANGNLQAESRGSGDTPEKMLVIAEDNLLSELEPLVTWKRQMGIHTTVVPVSTIGSSEADAVHDFVKTYYADHGISYLLLVGDEFAIKPHMRTSGGGSYACDNCFGYMSGDDHLPEILVGRLHANTPAQLRIMVNRNLEYEIEPLTDSNNNWMATAVASASDEGLGFGDDEQADWQHGNEWKTKHLADGYEQYWEFYDGDHAADSPTPGHFTADQPDDPAYSSLVNAMNTRGVSLYNYTGHGWEQGLVSGNFTNTAVGTLQNTGRYPILIAVACCAGNFTNGECLGEAWQRAGDYNTGQPMGGIAGFFSSDFQSWSPPMEGQDGMNQYLVDADGISLSPSMCGMMAYGNAKMIAAYDQGGEVMADFWIPFTDPTTVPRTRYPQTLAAAHTDSTAFGATNLTVACPVEGALVSLYWEGQTWAVARVQNGLATLEFAPLSNVADLVVTVTQFNHIPFQGTVRVKPAAQPFVINQPAAIDDSAAGNNNQRTDYGELVTLRIPLQNVGLASATNVQAALTTANPAVTLLDVQTNLGNLVNNASATVPFRFSVRNDVPNGSNVEFDLLVTYDGAPAQTTKITVPLYAPTLEVPSWSLESVTLSQNRLYGGEVAVVRILNRNTGGSDLPSAKGVLSSLSPYLAVPSTANIGLMSAGNGEQLATLSVAVSPATPPGTVAYLKYELQAGAYSVERLIGPFVINAIVETFESNDFKMFDWELPGNFPWTVSTVTPYSGSHCAQSGSIKENQSSTLQINLLVEEDGLVSFARRVSSEDKYDFLFFSIDNTVVGSWSGNVPWSEVSFPVSAGQHELRWTYFKDDFVNDGQDRAWVDEILLPKHTTATSTPAPEGERFNLAVAPNPTSGMLTVRLNLPAEQAVSIRVYDQLGRQVQTVQPLTRLAAGPFVRPLDLSGFAPGIYLVQVQGERFGEVVKVVRY
ncbi:MAG: C25 family cysteine peptidase [Saprospiraceae bacterium]